MRLSFVLGSIKFYYRFNLYLRGFETAIYHMPILLGVLRYFPDIHYIVFVLVSVSVMNFYFTEA